MKCGLVDPKRVEEMDSRDVLTVRLEYALVGVVTFGMSMLGILFGGWLKPTESVLPVVWFVFTYATAVFSGFVAGHYALFSGLVKDACPFTQGGNKGE